LRTVVLTLMAFATALVAAAGPVQADTMKASDVENICRTNNDTCKLFIFGLAQGLSIRETMSDQVSPNGQYANRKPVAYSDDGDRRFRFIVTGLERGEVLWVNDNSVGHDGLGVGTGFGCLSGTA
jgi:hypothetical protein